MDLFLIIWFIFAVIVMFGGVISLSIYKGYCESKGKHIPFGDEEDILFGLFALAALPATLFFIVIVGICCIPYFLGKLIGKYI